MSELIKPPADWAMHVDLSADDLQNNLGGHRLISIKSYVRDNQRVYAAISVKDSIPNLGWTANMTPEKLRQTVDLAGGRLISLDAFWDKDDNELRCAGVWIENSDGWRWNFGVDMLPVDIDASVRKERGKLTCVRVYTRPTNPDQNPPISFEEKYCAIWIEDDGVPWNWAHDIAGPELGLQLDKEVGRLISIDNHEPDSWSPDHEKLAAVWWKNVSFDVWFWNIGLDAAALAKEFPSFCSYGLDLVPAGPTQFASIMVQFPKPADPNQVTLISFSGSGNATFRDDLGQDINWILQHSNLTAASLNYTNALMLSAADSGWSWWSGNFTDPAGQNILGLPLVIAANGTNSSTPVWGVSNNPRIGVFILRLEDGTGKYQDLIAQAPITHSGFPSPPTLPIQWPVFLGIQGPVEWVTLTNSKKWLTVAAQVCNGTNRKTSIGHVSTRLKDPSDTLIHQADLTGHLVIDQDRLGMAVSPPVVGKVSGSTAPLAKFYDAFEVPTTFSAGTLHVQANVKFDDGELECYGDARELTVKPAPVHFMTRLPYNKPSGTPIYERNPNGPFRWHWGNGIGGTSFNAHSFPEHRYSYDLGVWDKNNQSFLDPAEKDQNSNYYVWELEVIAMLSGEVVFVARDFEDHFGDVSNPNSKGANVVVIHNKESNVFHVYAHFKKDSINVKVGDSVNPGDKLGLVGNSGGSSEPHLHVGLARRDANGFLLSQPMSFRDIRNGAEQTVSGVPVDGEFYS